tara:strand:+ start:1220 stop:1765 length:546 start_codon:yes stop_codon:yes gene_type:complete
MHTIFPKFFVFLDQYDDHIFKNNNINMGVIYRNYKAEKKEDELVKIAKACKKNRNQLFVSNDVKLAIKVKAEGIYIPSFNKVKGFANLEKRNIKILGSAHNQKEIQKKISQNCTTIFLSPIFYVEKSKKFLDIHKFNYLAYNNNADIFALGGISRNNIHKLKLLKIKGFGGIRMFKKKPAY